MAEMVMRDPLVQLNDVMGGTITPEEKAQLIHAVEEASTPQHDITHPAWMYEGSLSRVEIALKCAMDDIKQDRMDEAAGLRLYIETRALAGPDEPRVFDDQVIKDWDALPRAERLRYGRAFRRMQRD